MVARLNSGPLFQVHLKYYYFLALAAFISIVTAGCNRDEESGKSNLEQSNTKQSRLNGRGGDGSLAQSEISSHQSEHKEGGKTLSEFIEDVQNVDLDKLDSMAAEMNRYLIEDPRGTLDRMDDLSPGRRRDLLLAEVFRNYPKDRHYELVLWADESDLPEDRRLLHLILNVSGSGLAREDTARLYGSAKNPRTKELLAKFAASQSVEAGVVSPKGENLMSGVLSPQDRERFVLSFYSSLIGKDPLEAGGLILQSQEEVAPSIINSLGQSLGARKPREGAKLVESHLRGTSDYRLLGAFVSGWFSVDSIEASKWASTLPPHARDEAYFQVALELRRMGDPAAAAKILDGIQDESVKSRFK